jgi:hypothetical protein
MRAEVVQNYTDSDTKANLSFFVSICANGTKLLFILISRGKTMWCHQQLDDQVLEPHQIWYSPRGWSTEDLMLDYLDRLCEQLPIRSICLILDQYGTHETDNFKAKAQSQGAKPWGFSSLDSQRRD